MLHLLGNVSRVMTLSHWCHLSVALGTMTGLGCSRRGFILREGEGPVQVCLRLGLTLTFSLWLFALAGRRFCAAATENRTYVTRHAKMRRFSKIMVVCFIAYLDRADSDGSNDTSMLLIVTLFPEIHLFECRKCKMY